MFIFSRLMARAVLSMTILVGALTAFQVSEAKAVTFDWSFQGAFTYIAPGNDFIFPGEIISGSGTLSADYVSGSQYLVTSITGVVAGSGGVFNSISYPFISDTVTGPLGTGTFYNNDNNLFYPSTQQVDAYGLGFFGSGTSTAFNLFYGSCGGPVGYCLVTGGNSPGSLASITFEASPTPLPSTWTMLIAGFAGLGYIAYRGTKKRSVIAA